MLVLVGWWSASICWARCAERNGDGLSRSFNARNVFVFHAHGVGEDVNKGSRSERENVFHVVSIYVVVA